MLKFNSNILKIKLFYLKILGKINKNHFKINTFNKSKRVKRALLIFPFSENDYNVAKYCFRELSTNKSIDYYYLINNIFYSNFHFIGTTYGFNYINKNNKIIVNQNFYEDNILNKNFDVIIDLNSSFLLDIAMIINKIRSNYKIGFKSQYSDLFYNIQFETGTLEEGYSKINSMIH